MLGWKRILIVMLCLLMVAAVLPVSAQGYIDYDALEPEVGCPCWREFVRHTRVDLDYQIQSYFLRSWLRRAPQSGEVDLAQEVGGWHYRQYLTGAF